MSGRLGPWSASLGLYVLSRDNWRRALGVELDLVKREGQFLKLQLVIINDSLDWIWRPPLLFVGRRLRCSGCRKGSVYGGEDVCEIPDDLGGRGEV